MTLADFESQLLSLPESDRIHLVEVLWDSLASKDVRERNQRWTTEAERRREAVEAGHITLIDADLVIRQIRSKTRP